MKILLLDNYDSFTYNLLHAVKELGATDVEVVRNDQINLDEVERFDKIILSPGPGIPEEAGLLLPIIKRYAPTKEYFRRLSGTSGHRRGFWCTTGKPERSISRCTDTDQHPAEKTYFLKGWAKSTCRTLSFLGSQPGRFSRVPGDNC